jgi:hypothetical protein
MFARQSSTTNISNYQIFAVTTVTPNPLEKSKIMIHSMLVDVQDIDELADW